MVQTGERTEGIPERARHVQGPAGYVDVLLAIVLVVAFWCSFSSVCSYCRCSGSCERVRVVSPNTPNEMNLGARRFDRRTGG